jgi:hypothetical protein
MSFLDDLRDNLRKGYDFAREKGELGARVARLRLEILGLNRDREAAFNRLGRSYHANPGDATALEPLRREIDRLTQTVRDRESALVQLQQPPPPLELPAPEASDSAVLPTDPSEPLS